MTNETTASQPSIGDDAQFLNLLQDYRTEGTPAKERRLIAYINSYAPVAAVGCTNSPDSGAVYLVRVREGSDKAWVEHTKEFYARCDDTIFERRTLFAAPSAAQASATIQAAPGLTAGEFVRLIHSVEKSLPGEHPDVYLLAIARKVEDAVLAKSAATIQEPVMVAEPVGVVLPEALVLYEAENENITGYNADQMRAMYRAGQAAPMVADPAGVAVQIHQLRPEDIAAINDAAAMLDEEWPITAHQLRAILAATVKAVPSEAQDAERYHWMRRTFVDDEFSWPDDVANATNGALLDKAIDRAIANFAAPLADKTGGAQ